jgi:hypothetical protein
MLTDVLTHPRIEELLAQADEARTQLQDDDDPLAEHDVAEALSAIYEELGRAVHGLALETRHTRRSPPSASGPEVITLGALRRVMGESSRSGDLYALLSLLTPPADLLDPAAMPDEASKVQWASGELSGRLADAAREVQIAVLAMLAARARNVALHLEIDIGPRMAIDRLKRYRDHEDLPWVQGLVPNARPELDSWADDARAYWELLRPV